jgi:predicted DNA-binding protein (MmcQ/YjbR family)
MAVHPDDLRDHCLSFPGSEQTFPFGPETSVFKVAGKIFALSALSRTPLEVSLKCEPALAEQLRQVHPAVRPGYHLNKRHWNTVTLDTSLAQRLVEDMIEDSYDLVVSALPAARRRALLWRPDEP